MNVPFYIAKRYLFSKKSSNAVHIITAVSILGVTVGTAALILVLSAFNGLEALIASFYNAFDPDLKISLKEGKAFELDEVLIQQLDDLDGVVHYSQVIEEKALLRYRDKDYVAVIKGVEDQYAAITGLDSHMVAGHYPDSLSKGEVAIIGAGISYYLSLGVQDAFNPLSIYVPRRGKKHYSNPRKAFRVKTVFPVGIFSIQPDLDDTYLFLPIKLARELLNYPRELTALELDISDDTSVEEVQKELQALFGDDYKVQDRYQQQELLYKVMNSEHAFTFVVFAFILAIALFNVIGSLIMLILDKKEDIATLRSMGANKRDIRTIFLTEGLLVTATGAVFGLVLGLSIAWTQQHFGWVKLGGDNSNPYPVSIKIADIFYVFLTVMALGLLASRIAVGRLSGARSSLRKSNG